MPWIIRLRYGMVCGELAVVAAIWAGLQVSLPFAFLSVPIAIQLLTNFILSRRKEEFERNGEHAVGALFFLDTLCLTIILAATGGATNPFSLLYLVQITFSAVILHKAWTWALGILSTFCFGLLFWVSKDIPSLHLHIEPGEFSIHLFGMWLAFATAALLISFFIGKVSAEVRKKEQDLLAMQKRLARNDRLASLVTLAAGAAHEIATPLATIAVTAKEMEHDAVQRLKDPRMEGDAVLIRSQVERCRTILERMGAQGANPFGRTPRHIDFQNSADSRLRAFSGWERAGADRDSAGPSGFTSFPQNGAAEAIAALVKNALDASAGDQFIVLRVEPNGNSIRILVQDRGVGMTAEVMDRVLEPFFTTKPAGKGMGLGAFLAHLFAQQLGGRLSFQSKPGQGCVAVMELPLKPHVQK